jgi:hypothetical protein
MTDDKIAEAAERALAECREKVIGECAVLARDLLHPEAGDGRTWNAFQRDFAHAAEIVSAKIRALKKEPRT